MTRRTDLGDLDAFLAVARRAASAVPASRAACPDRRSAMPCAGWRIDWLAVKQRTQVANAVRGHLAEDGWVAPKGAAHLAMLADLLEDGEIGQTLPEAARPMFATMIDMLAVLDKRIAELDKEITRRAREDEVARRLMTIPGIGPITATATGRDIREGS